MLDGRCLRSGGWEDEKTCLIPYAIFRFAAAVHVNMFFMTTESKLS